MLFETFNKQPGGKPAAIPGQQAPSAPLRSNTAGKNPQVSSTTATHFRANPVTSYNNVVQRPVKSPLPITGKAVLPQKNPGTPGTGQQNKQVKGWPGYQQAAQQTKSSMVKTAPPQKGNIASAISGQKKQVIGWPGYQQATKQSQASMVKPVMPQKDGTSVSGMSGQKKQVIGWPGYRQAPKQPIRSMASGSVTPQKRPMPLSMQKPVKKVMYQPGLQKLQQARAFGPTQKGYWARRAPTARQKAFTASGGYRQGVQSPQGYVATTPAYKSMNAPAIAQPGQTPRIGKRFYDARTKRYFNYSGNNAPLPAYTALPGTPPAQTTVTGWPSNQGYNVSKTPPQPCDCSGCAHKANPPVSAAMPYSRTARVPLQQAPQRRVPAQQAPQQQLPPQQVSQQSIPQQQVYQQQVVRQPVCPTCGLNTKGCTTLSGFALNSILLNPYHKKQLRKLAAAILHQNSNAVVATGHTNNSKTEELIENLGERRALAVVTELKRQLSKLKPGAQKNIFWKTVSKAITQTEVSSHAANRRVEICTRQLR